MTYLFTKAGCGKCEWVKKNVDLNNMNGLHVVELGDDDPEALATLAYYECVSLSEKHLPILVNEDREIVTGALHIRKVLTQSTS